MRPNADTFIDSSHRPSPRRSCDDGQRRLRGRTRGCASARYADVTTHRNGDTDRHAHRYANPHTHANSHAHACGDLHSHPNANGDAHTHAYRNADPHAHAHGWRSR